MTNCVFTAEELAEELGLSKTEARRRALKNAAVTCMLGKFRIFADGDCDISTLVLRYGQYAVPLSRIIKAVCRMAERSEGSTITLRHRTLARYMYYPPDVVRFAIPIVRDLLDVTGVKYIAYKRSSDKTLVLYGISRKELIEKFCGKKITVFQICKKSRTAFE